MAPTPGNRALLTQLNEINAALGLEPMAELDPLRRGAGDISFVADKLDGWWASARRETAAMRPVKRRICPALTGRLNARHC